MRVLAVLVILAAPATAQTTWYVDGSNTPPGSGTIGDPYTSIQYAIEQSTTVDGDTVQVAPGTYAERLDFLGKAILVDGSGGATLPVVDAEQQGSVVTFRSGEDLASELRGFELRGGAGTELASGPTGGGILVLGASPRLAELTIRSNQADQGGGMAALGGAAPKLLDCRFEDNEARKGGGLYVQASRVELEGGTFDGNFARLDWGATRGGGVRVRAGGSLVAHDVEFRHNRAHGPAGGGALANDAGTFVDLTRCRFAQNHVGPWDDPGVGGAIHCGGTLVAKECLFVVNGSTHSFGASSGGAAWGGTYFDCTFRGNAADLGGALAHARAVGCWFEANVACSPAGNGAGGAALDCTLTDCTLVANRACGEGGGAHESTLVDCLLVSNVAGGESMPFGAGGGAFGGSARGCGFRGNRAEGLVEARGGGACNADLERCVLANNVAQQGGGVALTAGSHALRQCSFARNAAGLEGGGLYVASTTSVENSVLWGNEPGAVVDTSGTLAVGYSIVQGGWPGTGNLDQDPRWFGPAGSDVHLMAGSPAIDAGDPSSPPEPDGSRADMGSLTFEPAWTGGAFAYCQTEPVLPKKCVPLAGSEGVPSISSPDEFAALASDVPPGEPGLLLFGVDPAWIALPGGTLCIAPPLQRFPPQLSSAGPGACGGAYRQVIDAGTYSAMGLTAGDRLLVQFWLRRPPGLGPAALSEALEILIQP